MTMSLDRRLRVGLAELATAVDPDVPGSLAEVLARGRARRRAARTQRIALAGAACLAIGAVSATVLFHLGRDGDSSVTASVPPDPNYVAVAGTYVGTVEAPTATPWPAEGVVGDWSLRLEVAGRLELVPPPGFAGQTAPARFSVDGSRLRTNVSPGGLCAGTSGLYNYGISGGRLRLVTINDPCEMRAALLGTRQWGRVPAISSGTGSTGALPFVPDDGSVLGVGRYTTEFLPRLEIDPPPGWTGNSDTIDWVGLQDGPGNTASSLSFVRIESVYVPDTNRRRALPRDLVGWFTSHPAIQVVTPPRPTTVGGHPATRLDVRLAPNWQCGQDGCVQFAPLQPGEPDAGWATDVAARIRVRLYIIQLPGVSVVGAFAADRTRFQGEVGSVETALRTVSLG
jgi:hypothetical protein